MSKPAPLVLLTLLPLLLAQSRPAEPVPRPLLPPSTLPPEKLVEPPFYTAWANLPDNTEIEIVTEDPQDPKARTITVRRLAKTPDGIVLEIRYDDDDRMPRLLVPAKVEPGEEGLCSLGVPLPGARSHLAVISHDVQDVNVTEGAKTLDAKLYTVCYDIGVKDDPWILTHRMWLAPSLPGGLVKTQLDQNPRRGLPARATVTSTVTQRTLPPATQPAK